MASTKRHGLFVRGRSQLIVAVLMAFACSQADANLLTRMLDRNKKDDKATAPAGASNSVGSDASVGSVVSLNDNVLLAHLSNNNKIPLVGVGVGNTAQPFVGAIVAEAIQDDKKIRLIDTSHAADNEELVAKGILAGVDSIVEQRQGRNKKKKIQVHVVTKVWYTHLGYQRTKVAVEETLASFKDVRKHNRIDFKLHVLLHWPRCYDDIPWMDCHKEEESLPDHIRTAGPNPTEDKDNAWKESWRLLEDLYLSDKYPIASIGVSNFGVSDLEKMDSIARIHPHILQANVWSLLYDQTLIEYCHQHRIHVQAYNIMQGTLGNAALTPRALKYIRKVAYELSEEAETTITPGQTILAWLVQHGVSVIPRTSKVTRLEENSMEALNEVPFLTDHQVETVAVAVEAQLDSADLEEDIHVSVTFHAVNKDLMIFWQNGDSEEDSVRVAYLKQGETFNETTFPDHVFRTYDAQNKDVYVDHKIQANFGDHKDIRVEL